MIKILFNLLIIFSLLFLFSCENREKYLFNDENFSKACINGDINYLNHVFKNGTPKNYVGVFKNIGMYATVKLGVGPFEKMRKKREKIIYNFNDFSEGIKINCPEALLLNSNGELNKNIINVLNLIVDEKYLSNKDDSFNLFKMMTESCEKDFDSFKKDFLDKILKNSDINRFYRDEYGWTPIQNIKGCDLTEKFLSDNGFVGSFFSIQKDLAFLLNFISWEEVLTIAKYYNLTNELFIETVSQSSMLNSFLLLFLEDIDINYEEYGPISAVTEIHDKDMISFLVKYGADINFLDYNGETLLDKNRDLTDFLKNLGAKRSCEFLSYKKCLDKKK
ncbi:hypothetical protein JXR93_13905 [bacterium]|nr:hypothetical protein [bacterium]